MPEAETVASRAPAWFAEVLRADVEESAVDVDGCAITTRAWGDPDHPGIVLVHGGAAHARWWDHLGPFLAANHRVVALDLSGHGDAGRRAEYPPTQWAAEVRAVARAQGMIRPVVVGHSMGGFVGIVGAATYGEELAGLVVVDSPVRRPDPEREAARDSRVFRNPKTYPTLEEALEHFMLVPPQPCEHDWLLEHVGRHSLRRGDAGWTWKFDPRVFGRFTPRDPLFSDYLGDARCRVAVIHGEHSRIVTGEVTAWMNELLGRNAPFVEIPAAHHHLVLDQPLAFVAAVRALLSDWEHTVPRA